MACANIGARCTSQSGQLFTPKALAMGALLRRGTPPSAQQKKKKKGQLTLSDPFATHRTKPCRLQPSLPFSPCFPFLFFPYPLSASFRLLTDFSVALGITWRVQSTHAVKHTLSLSIQHTRTGRSSRKTKQPRAFSLLGFDILAPVLSSSVPVCPFPSVSLASSPSRRRSTSSSRRTA